MNDKKELLINSMEQGFISLKLVRNWKELHRTGISITATLSETSLSLGAVFEDSESKCFLSDLNGVYRKMKGKAQLVDEDFDATIEFRAIPGPGGRFLVGGYCGHYDYNETIRSIPDAAWVQDVRPTWLRSKSGSVGLEFAFDGLILDQSYVPNIINGFENLLL